MPFQPRSLPQPRSTAMPPWSSTSLRSSSVVRSSLCSAVVGPFMTSPRAPSYARERLASMKVRGVGVVAFVLGLLVAPATFADEVTNAPAPARTAAAANSTTSATAPAVAGTNTPAVDHAAAARLAALALACVHQEYPNKVSHVLASDADAKPPRELHPAFYGCYDWHSSVHGHWLLARLARRGLDEATATRARA